MKKFLHVGCGMKHKDQTTRGFNSPAWEELRFDIDETVKPDLIGTMTDMTAVQSGSVDAWHDFGGGISAGAGATFAANRRDVNARTFAQIDHEDFSVTRVYAAWQVTPRLTVKARLENLLDESYEEVNGYPALGFGAFGGVEWKF
jgi:outer membrane receptor protein involved in Fe transport